MVIIIKWINIFNACNAINVLMNSEPFFFDALIRRKHINALRKTKNKTGATKNEVGKFKIPFEEASKPRVMIRALNKHIFSKKRLNSGNIKRLVWLGLFE